MRRPRLLLSVVSLFAVLGAGTLTSVPAGATAGPIRSTPGLMWNLASDFRLSPDQANPNPDQFGNSKVWYFLKGSSSDPDTYTRLHRFINDAFSIEGLQQWEGKFDSTSSKDKLPAVGINATGTDQHPYAITWPAGTIRIHPLFSRMVVVGWRSPVAGMVDISVGLTDMDTSCGNGIRWIVRRNGQPSLGSAVMPNGGSAAFDATATVRQGDFIYVIVGPNHRDDDCDSTQLDEVITRA